MAPLPFVITWWILILAGIFGEISAPQGGHMKMTVFCDVAPCGVLDVS
jgi:hypothetical protein